jgi:hypothetical protein
MPSVFAGAFFGSALTAVCVSNFVSSSRPWPSGGPRHCDVDSDIIEPDDTVHPPSLDWRLAHQLHTKFDKECSSSLKVVDNDADVVHPLNPYPRAQGSDGWLGRWGVASSARGFRRQWSAWSGRRPCPPARSSSTPPRPRRSWPRPPWPSSTRSGAKAWAEGRERSAGRLPVDHWPPSSRVNERPDASFSARIVTPAALLHEIDQQVAVVSRALVYPCFFSSGRYATNAQVSPAPGRAGTSRSTSLGCARTRGARCGWVRRSGR